MPQIGREMLFEISVPEQSCLYFRLIEVNKVLLQSVMPV